MVKDLRPSLKLWSIDTFGKDAEVAIL